MNFFLHFSDAAKFAEVAKNITLGNGFGSDFSFFGSQTFKYLSLPVFPQPGILPVMPFSIAFFFEIFGINDFAVIATSFFYFLLMLVFVFLLAKKVFRSNLVAFLSVLVCGFSYDLVNYATSGASESPFIFEIVAAFYFLTLKQKWATVITFLLMVAMYFTRPQSVIFIAGILLYYLLLRFKIKKAIPIFLGLALLGLFVDRYVLSSLAGKYFLYSITGRGLNATKTYLPGVSASDALRGAGSVGAPFVSILKKVFYNLYNFYKLMPQIINPYLFAFFVLNAFWWSKDRVQNSFNFVSIFVFLLTFFATALSIPFFRYLHPVIPFVYIVACGTIVKILTSQTTRFKKLSVFNLEIKRKNLILLASSILILFFAVGQTVGVFVLDTRYIANTHNLNQPPIYVVLSNILKKNTSVGQTVVTNLDTWGSWYGERKTVWFPLTPNQIRPSEDSESPFDAIYLTSYLINDENYYMGAEWRQIFDNPKDESKWTCEGCRYIKNNYTLKGVYKLTPDQTYENMQASAVLLIKKKY